MGAGVVIGRFYGARQIEKVQKAIHTTIAFGLAAGAALTVIGVLLTPQLLLCMGTPDDVLPNSIIYFRIYFCGSLAFVLYNIFVGILQSVGDSRHPLIYLIISSVVNILLDLLFVGVFRFGVGSAALATIISQFASAILCLILLSKSPEDYRVHFRKIRFDFFFLKQIIQNVSRIPSSPLPMWWCRPISTVLGKWPWPDAGHIPKSRALAFFQSPASPCP